MAKPKGLGRGLDALLGGDESTPAAVSAGLAQLPIASLQPGKYQPRTRMDQASLNALAESIKAQGVMQPVLVRPLSDERYEIVAGERRWRAARIAGLQTVPALIREIPDQQALSAALIENIQREDLNPIEEAQGIQRLTTDFGLTHEAVSVALGRSRPAVTNLLRLLELPPPVRDFLGEGKIGMGHARALLALPVGRQVEMARDAVEQGWSVRDVERRVSHALKAANRKAVPRTDRDVARLEEEWSGRLGTTVQIKAGARSGSGRLILHYRTLDQLELLLAKLGNRA